MSRLGKLIYTLCLPVSFICIDIKAQDIPFERLDSTVLTEKANVSHIRRNPDMGFVVDMDIVKSLPKLLGSSDPMRYMQYLPGVQMNAEHDNGIRINGCDHAHNSITLNGIPVYGAAHMFGLFSMFNPSHFDGFMMTTGNLAANRLGGSVDMHTRLSIPESTALSLSAGLMETEATVGIPIGKKTALFVSARRSYLNLLYSSFLKIDNVPIKYSLTDVNVSAVRQISSSDRIWADFYWGRDYASLSLSEIEMGVKLNWGNLVGGLNWEHKWERASLVNSLSFSGFDNIISANQAEMALDTPSNIRDVTFKSAGKAGEWNFGMNAIWHDVLLQAPSIKSPYMANTVSEKQNGLEADLYGSRTWRLGWRWRILTFLKGGYYLSPERKSYFSLSPVASVTCDFFQAGALTLKGEIQHQNLFQTGISNIGLPVEFWMMAGSLAHPQTSAGGSLSYNLNFGSGAYALSAELYYKKLSNQLEYTGNLFDLLSGNYDLRKSMVVGNGKNYGATLMLHKKSGALTGWISYSYGRAWRYFHSEGLDGRYPSSHERPHEINAVATYRLDKWDFGGTFVFASGTPFTATEAFYINGGRIMVKYAGFNAARLQEYVRLDLSVNYYFHRGKDRENGLNFSMYNILGRKNPIFYRLRFENSGDADRFFCYDRLNMNLRWLPSISYFHKF